jgi:hypothetical protein
VHTPNVKARMSKVGLSKDFYLTPKESNRSGNVNAPSPERRRSRVRNHPRPGGPSQMPGRETIKDAVRPRGVTNRETIRLKRCGWTRRQP